MRKHVGDIALTGDKVFILWIHWSKFDKWFLKYLRRWKVRTKGKDRHYDQQVKQCCKQMFWCDELLICKAGSAWDTWDWKRYLREKFGMCVSQRIIRGWEIDILTSVSAVHACTASAQPILAGRHEHRQLLLREAALALKNGALRLQHFWPPALGGFYISLWNTAVAFKKNPYRAKMSA